MGKGITVEKREGEQVGVCTYEHKRTHHFPFTMAERRHGERSSHKLFKDLFEMVRSLAKIELSTYTFSARGQSTVNYWIISLPRPDMEHCIKLGTFGLSRKYKIGDAKPGDKVACYVTKESKIVALGEVTSEYYLDNKRIFKGDGLFPDRFDFNAKLLGSEAEIDFKSIVDDLSFITNKFYWTVYLRGGIAKIPEKDWELIEGKVGAGV